MLSVASLQPPGNGKLFEITEVLGIETLTSEIDSTQYYGLCVVFVVCGKIVKFSTCKINNSLRTQTYFRLSRFSRRRARESRQPEIRVRSQAK